MSDLEQAAVELKPQVNVEFNPGKNPRSPRTEATALKFPPYMGLQLLGTNGAGFNATVDNLPDYSIGKSPANVKWAQAISKASEHLQGGNIFDRSVSREGASWRQSVEHEGEEIAFTKPRLGETSGSSLVGDAAMFKVQAALNLGATVTIPLWHSGVYLSIRAPKETTLGELSRRIAEEKSTLGRVTNGMVFSNSSIYITSYLLNVIFAHVYDSNLRDSGVENLKEAILVTDIPHLILGFVAAIYPNGYPLSQPCIADHTKCTHVVEELVNIARLAWVDNARLSSAQRALMSRKNSKKKYSLEEVRSYQAMHAYPLTRTVAVNEAISAVLAVPNIAAYEGCGFGWVDGIERMCDDAFKHSLRGNERETYMLEQAKATTLRSYGHWISKFVFDDGSSIDDRDAIEANLEWLSSDGAITDTIFNNIGEYIDETTLAIVAIPSYTCPACNGNQALHNSVSELLIPLEVSRIFFTLLGQRVAQISLRGIR